MFVAAVKDGDVEKAKALYAPARMHYERIEPVAESFGDLDPRIDARKNDVEAGQEWTGWHLVEHALWVDGSLKGMGPVADQLLADTRELVTKVGSIELTADQITNGAKELLDEVANSKVTGEEERYSHTDLWAFQANVEGAKEAYEVVEPVVEAKDPALKTTLDTAFAAAADRAGPLQGGRRLRALHRPHRRPGQGPGGEGRGSVRAALRAHGHRRLVTSPSVSRRRVLGFAAGGAALGVAGVGAAAVLTGQEASAGSTAEAAIAFEGAHQAGITTPVQDRLHFAAFDVTTTDVGELRALLKEWTHAARAA